MKKLVLLFMVIVIFQLIYADGTPAAGNGTETDPYQIATIDNLLWLSTTENVWDNSYYFLQTQDIDASDTYVWNEGSGFSPIGLNENNSFNGYYNGDNHFIDGLYILRNNDDNIGLFGYTHEAVIEALGVININVTGYCNVGGLVGENRESTIITSYTTGSVTGVHMVGGLVGWSYLNSSISNSYTIGSVTGGNIVGGLVGHNRENSSISDSYAAGSVNGSNEIGGLVGINWDSSISDSYAICNVTGNHYAGGLVGENESNSTLSKSYAKGNVTGNYAVGGLVGENNTSQISNCIWNIETCGQMLGIGNEESGTITNLLGKTTAEMQIMSTYTDIGWDFAGENINGTEDIWDINNMFNFNYPYISDLEYSLYDNLLANFNTIPNSGPVPLTVNFMDRSVSQSSIIVSWEWDFQNDGVIDSYEQNPDWEYTEQGYYSVRLIVCNDITRETSTEVKEDYITVYCGNIMPQGSGTETDPYLVENINNLLWISTNESCWCSNFLQTEDIDASDTQNWNEGAGFSPIGNEYQLFQGTYIGGNHIINELYINRPGSDFIGLFGNISGAVVETLGVTNINVTGNNEVGSLVGWNTESPISECYASGRVSGNGTTGGLIGGGVESTLVACYASGNVTGNERAGGLVGSSNYSTLYRCYFLRSVSGGDDVGGLVGHSYYSTINKSYASIHANGDINVGGLVGGNSGSIISESYATGIVNGNLRVGGLVGINNNSTLNDNYAKCTITGNNYIGGLAGDNCHGATISECYSAGTEIGNNYVGGFVGRNWDSQIENCIWNIEISMQTIGVGDEIVGTITNLLGKTTAEMQIMSTYTDIGWDFVGENINGTADIWDINYEINDGFPFICDIENPVGENENVIQNSKLKIQNYPNPFNPETQIIFYLPETGKVRLSVYNLKGQLVKILADEVLLAGENRFIWDGRNENGRKVSSGVYLVQLRKSNEIVSKKIMLIK